MLRVHVGPEGVTLPVLPIDTGRQEEADLVPLRGVEHAALEADGPDGQAAPGYPRCLPEGRGIPQGGEIDAEPGPGAVPAEEETLPVAAVLRKLPRDVIEGSRQRAQDGEEVRLRGQGILRAEDQKAPLRHVGAEEAVHLLLSQQEAAAVEVHQHRQDAFGVLWPEHVHPLPLPAGDIRRHGHIPRQGVLPLPFRHPGLQLPLLLGRLPADHSLPHGPAPLSCPFVFLYSTTTGLPFARRMPRLSAESRGFPSV